MAVVTVAKKYGSDIRLLDFSVFRESRDTQYSSTKFIFDYGTGWWDEFRGSGFKYNALGAVAGTVSGFSTNFGPVRVVSIDGTAVSAVSIVKAGRTHSTSDDFALIRSVLAGNDRFHGGELTDYWDGGAGNDTMYGNGGDDTLLGNSGNDTLIGGAGDDKLDGGAGADVMVGGAGHDDYIVDNANDKINEAVAGSNGGDTVEAYVSFNLADTTRVAGLVEDLYLVGSAAINGTGNYRDNLIHGNGGANTLSGAGGGDLMYGWDGNDTLYGGAGNDKLMGGSGVDSFVFDTSLNVSTNVDVISDFGPGFDKIKLDNAVMAGLGATLGTLSVVKFWMNTTGLAHDADDRIIYQIGTGKLFYDANGSAAGGGVHFATLSNKAAITNLDFAVI